ncbi:hypothetical protein ABPG72_017592 [Tetrahymena utriculariae]
MSLSVEAQKQIIIKEFQKVKVSSTQKLNKDELFQVLDKKLGRQYDRAIADQLIAKLDTDEDGKFQAEQFFSIIIEAGQTLLDKIEQSRDFLQELTQKRKNVQKKYEEEMQKEKKNEYNIMEGSMFSVKPIKILQIDKKIMKDEDRAYLREEYYVKVMCDKYSDNVAWEQISSFPIKTSTEDIFVVLYKVDGDEPVAKTDLIQLNGLRDQKKVSSDVYMNSFDGKQKKIYQIQLELQWIHSKTEIYEEIIQDWDNQIRQHEDDLNGYQNDLISLLEPFPGLSPIVKQMESQQENFQFESTSGMNLNTRELKNRNSFTYDSNILIPSSQQSIQVQDVFKTLGYSNFAYMILALILSYERVLTLDMLICMSYFIEIYTKGEYNVNNFKLYSLFTIASVAFDIIWFVLFTVKWWSDDIPNQKLQRAVVVLSFVYLALKVYLSSLYLYLYRDYSKNPEQKLQDNITFNTSPKASFAIQENINVVNPNFVVKDPYQIDNRVINPQPVQTIPLNNTSLPYPPQLYLISSKKVSMVNNLNNGFQNNSMIISQQNIMNSSIHSNPNYNNSGRISYQVNSKKPSVYQQQQQAFLPDNNYKDSAFKNYQMSSPQTQSYSQNQNQQYYISSFNQNNYIN